MTYSYTFTTYLVTAPRFVQQDKIIKTYRASTDLEAMQKYCMDSDIQNLSMEEVDRTVIVHTLIDSK